MVYEPPEGLRVVEYTPELAEDALAVRNAIFPPIPLEEWLTATSMTGALAYLGDEVVGCIPMDRRDFLIAPRTPARVLFENAVGTREDMRSKGIGTAMIRGAKRFLADRIDAMLVYRGAERSRGYRFYANSGHHDLVYLRHSRWAEPSGSARGTAIGGLAEIEADAAGIHAAFAATYDRIAGYPVRSAGYQRRQMDSHIYMVLPHDFVYVRYPVQGELEAYCIAGVRGKATREPTVAVLEMATRTGDGIREVLSALGVEAGGRQMPVTRHTSQDDPFRLLTRGLGFVESPRQTMILGQIVRPQILFEKACTDLQLVADLKINVWTPTEDYTLYEGPGAKTEVTVEAKDTAIARLLCRRLDVRSAVAHDVISVRDGTPDITYRLASALPFSPWVYHHLDYI